MEPIILEPGAGDGSDERKTKLSLDNVGIVEFDVDRDDVGDHTHEQHEIFQVLEGRMRFRVDGNERELEAGGFIFVPAGTRHGFGHDARARYLVISAPGGLEEFFAATETAENSGASEGDLKEIALSFGTRFLD